MKLAAVVLMQTVVTTCAMGQAMLVVESNSPTTLASVLSPASSDRIVGVVAADLDYQDINYLCCGELPGVIETGNLCPTSGSRVDESLHCNPSLSPKSYSTGVFAISATNLWTTSNGVFGSGTSGVAMSTGCVSSYGSNPTLRAGNVSTQFNTIPMGTTAASVDAIRAHESIMEPASDASRLRIVVESCSEQALAFDVVFGSEETINYLDCKPDAFGVLSGPGLSVIHSSVVRPSVLAAPHPDSFYYEEVGLGETILNGVQVKPVNSTIGSPPPTFPDTHVQQVYVPANHGVYNAATGNYEYTIEFVIFDGADAVLDSTVYISTIRSAGDINRDGFVDSRDFTAWLHASNTGDMAADQNNDGFIAPGDFTAWLGHNGDGCTE